MNKQCDECNDPTKYVTGFWDGQDPKTGRATHGYMFGCRSKTCELKKEMDKQAAESQAEIDKIHKQHKDRGIDLEFVETSRKEKQINIRKFSDMIGISASLYCDYRGHRKEIPQETYDKMIEVLKP